MNSVVWTTASRRHFSCTWCMFELNEQFSVLLLLNSDRSAFLHWGVLHEYSTDPSSGWWNLSVQWVASKIFKLSDYIRSAVYICPSNGPDKRLSRRSTPSISPSTSCRGTISSRCLFSHDIKNETTPKNEFASERKNLWK